MLWLSFTLLALFASVQGRAVNISNTWVLPEEGFPVFYRYFRDRISWYEADAVCQFHHANLVTVDTTAQYDAVRAYLKELDISSAVWVGLIRSNPDGDFTWTDYRGLSGEGYWSSAPDSRAAPLCAAADPAADYRWEARACGGPTVASFICELPGQVTIKLLDSEGKLTSAAPKVSSHELMSCSESRAVPRAWYCFRSHKLYGIVLGASTSRALPQWALGNDGCMVRALPALTALYLPESAAVQLTADCGLAGVKRVQCTGNVKRDELLKDLSCNDEDDQSSTASLTSSSTTWPVTDTSFSDQETTTEDISTEYTSNTATHITETPTPSNVIVDVTEVNTPAKENLKPNDFVRIPLDNNIILEQIHISNILSNEIPQPEQNENFLTEQKLKQMEDNKKIQHKLLHDEMSRLSNLDTIFTQPTDHFVPPLVMAKARISDDMTVLSLREKHAQQMAEKRLLKHNLLEHVNLTPPQTTTLTPKSTTTDVPLVTEVKQHTDPAINNLKKDVKSSVPKKYIHKYNSLKAKSWKTVDSKIQKAEEIEIQSTSQISNTTKDIETTTAKIENELKKDPEENSIIDLTVIIKEPGAENGQQIFYSNHSNSLPTTEVATNVTELTLKENITHYSTTKIPALTTNAVTQDGSASASAITLNHEIIKITVVTDKINTEKSTPVVFEVATLMPVFNNKSEESKDPQTSNTIGYTFSPVMTTTSTPEISSTSISSPHQQTDAATAIDKKLVTVNSAATTKESVTSSEKEVTSIDEDETTHDITDTITVATAKLLTNVKDSEKNPRNYTLSVDLPANLTEATEKIDLFNQTDTEHIDEESDQHESDVIDDYQSPLLSAANEPLHRPNRSRRPQTPPNRMNKFNPFRILG